MMEGKLFDNLEKFIEKIREIRERDYRIDIEKRGVELRDEFEILDGLRVLGVDGSQINPLKDFGIPFGGVQSAGITVYHGKGDYDVSYKSRIVLDTNMELERFRLEVEMIKSKIDSIDYAFFDGSLGAFYTSELSEALKKAYQKEIDSLIELSEKFEVPVIGYVDRSYTRDLGYPVYDSYLLADCLELYEYTSPIKTKSPLNAIYFKSNPSLPSRIEIPEWCSSKAGDIMKVVFAECRLGSTSGYPYILERAHYYARVDEREKRAFVRLVKSSGVSFKYLSKVIL